MPSWQQGIRTAAGCHVRLAGAVGPAGDKSCCPSDSPSESLWVILLAGTGRSCPGMRAAAEAVAVKPEGGRLMITLSGNITCVIIQLLFDVRGGRDGP